MSDTHRAHDRYKAEPHYVHLDCFGPRRYMVVDTHSTKIIESGMSRDSAIAAASRLNAQPATTDEEQQSWPS